MPTVTLKPGHVRPVWSGHPWVFAQAIARIEGGAIAGDEVTVVDPHGTVLGTASTRPNPQSLCACTRGATRPIDGALFPEAHRAGPRLQARARGSPAARPGHETDAFRLVHAEGDGLPGLVVDLFGDVAAVQLNTIGIKLREGVIFDTLTPSQAARHRRPDRPVARQKERVRGGLGIVRGDDSLKELTFIERGLNTRSPWRSGRRPGFTSTSGRSGRASSSSPHGKRVLDTYTFVGTFAMARPGRRDRGHGHR
jgi:23S rRNA (cytosine1962-C5)-methyltransferase